MEQRPRRAAALLPLFALSGACGLCFEILWARQLQVVLGATSKAVTTVVSVFMVGLALGSALGGRWAPRLRRPAVAYAACELGIGLSAIAVTALLPALEGLVGMGARHAIALPLLLGPSLLMGMTFPLVTQAADPRARAGAGALYAANTAGAAVGCVLTGFLGIGLLGIRGTATVVAACNLLVGATAWSIYRRARTSPPVAGDDAPAGVAPASAGRAILGVAALCGASALAIEILWTRALVPHLNSSSYAFAAIMATYLVGIAAGSAWVGLACGRLDTRALGLRLGMLQLALALLVALSPRLMTLVEAVFPGYLGVRRVVSFAGWAATVAAVFGKTALVVLPATFIMGASLPLCIAVFTRNGQAGGKVAGLVSAVNTVGGVVGSLVAGFVLLPRLGSIDGMVVAAAGNVLAAALTFAGVVRVRLGRVLLVAAAGVVCLALVRPGDARPFLGRLASGARVLLVDEGPQDTTAVIERSAGATTHRLILSNGISYAGDEPPAQRYMSLLGHLPVLFSGDASRALVICAGTGTTAGTVALYPEVRALDLVDISPAVQRTLPLFAHVNHAVWADARTTLHEADGRQFMTRAADGYGVITLEPPPPRAAGAASLYTTGLYRRARQVMRPDGVIAQWLPLHGMTEVEILTLARTFLAVFPEAALFVLNPDEAALLGSPRPLVLDVGLARRRLAEPPVRAALTRIGFLTDEPLALATDLLALAPIHGPALAALVGDGPVITDDQPLIEQFAMLLTADAQRARDPDGRRGLLRQLLRAAAPPVPYRGADLSGLALARRAVDEQMRGWPGVGAR